MMKLYLALTLTLLCAQAAHADVITDFDTYLRANGVTHFDGVSGSLTQRGNKPLNLRVDWQQSATNDEKALEQSLAESFSWVPIIRNLPAFVMAVRTEPTFNAQIRDNMGKLLGLVLADYNAPALAHQDWSDAINNPDNAGWLSSDVQTTVLGFAKSFSIPLTADIP